MGTDERGALWFRVLGPLEVWRGGRPVPLGGQRQRALLAILLVHANQLVSTERLADQLQGPDSSATSTNGLRVTVSRLRKALGAEDLLHTRPGGYVLELAPEQLDCAVFERLLEDGRKRLADDNAAHAALRLREALELWQGEPLANVRAYECLQPEIRRLEQLRLLAHVERVKAELQMGAGAELIPELRGLIELQPLEERLQGHLMTALYRAGRQREALEVYRHTSELLRSELGLEPSPELQTLERAILNHDPSLAPPPPVRATASIQLPQPTTAFLGRSHELRDLTDRVQAPDTRLLTLTGAGGSGKTRLALEVARRSAARYPDGVWFVGFADIADPQLIAATICTGLGLADHASAPPQRLRGWVGERELLLVLDNLEQLIEGTPVLGELLAWCLSVERARWRPPSSSNPMSWSRSAAGSTACRWPSSSPRPEPRSSRPRRSSTGSAAGCRC